MSSSSTDRAIYDLVAGFNDQTDIDRWLADVRSQVNSALNVDVDDDTYLGPGMDQIGNISGRVDEMIIEHTEQVTFEIEQQVIRAKGLSDRAGLLEKMGYMTKERASEIQRFARRTLSKLDETRARINIELAKYNKALHDAVTSMSISAESWIHDKIDTDLDKLKQDLSSLKDEFQKVHEEAAAARNSYREAVDAYNANPTDENLNKVHEAEKAADAAHESEVKAEQAVNKVKNQIIELGDKARRSWTGSGLKLAEDSMKAVGISIKGIWAEFNILSAQYHTAWAHITEGYNRYLRTINGEIEFASELWQEARMTTRGLAEREANGIAKEIATLKDLALKEDLSEFYVQAAKYMAPSSRMLIMATEEFDEIIMTSSKFTFFIKLLNPFFLIKQIMRTTLSGVFRVSELTLGVEITEGITRMLVETGAAVSPVLEWILGPEAAALMIAVEAGYDLNKDGFTNKFLDDIFSMFFISFKDTYPGEGLKEYPMFSKELPFKGLGDANPLNFLEYDWRELSSVLDFWGARYKKFMNKTRDRKYAEYKKMAKFKAIQRIPGRYINPKNHPLDTNQELEECLSIENELDANTLVSKDYVSPSLVNQYFPRKAGLVRNLANFPLYKKSYQWVDVDNGLPMVLHGNFVEQDLDPDIVALFKFWATSGKFGSAYNGAKTRTQQRQIEAMNKADLQQYLNPKHTWFMASTELNQWINTARGKQGISVSDMIILAPKDFDQEWLKDLPQDEFEEYGVKFKWPSAKHQYDLYYREKKTAVGRYTYHPKDRKFLQDAANGTVMTADIVFPGAFPPSGCVENFEWVMPDGQVVQICIHPVKASDAERKEYKNILDKGNEYRAELDRRKSMTQQEWDNFTVQTVWKSYVRAEKPFRTLWGYITKYKSFFMQELMFVTLYLDSKNKTELWKEYMKYIQGRHVPLNMSSTYRTMFMGVFAKGAYSNKKKDAQGFHDAIEKRFEKILENDLVTTHEHGDWGAWAAFVHNVFQSRVQVDWPVFFGDLNCRMFVLQKPHVVVLAFKGTSSAAEWVIDADFSVADYVKRGQMKDDIVEFKADTSATGTFDMLETDPTRFKVHRGFLRAWEAMKPLVNKQLYKYYQKYPGLQDVFITGHSLGAALAQLAGLMIPRLPIQSKPTLRDIFNKKPVTTTYRNPHCYMYASPLVGDARFQRMFDELTSESVQVWNDGDGITALPPFLIPAADVSASAHRNVLKVLESLGSKDRGMGAILFAFDEMLEHASLEGWQTLESLFKDAQGFSGGSIAKGAVTSLILYNRHRPRRGGEVFLRLDKYDGRVTFDESLEDIGNSDYLFKQLAGGSYPFERTVRMHSMDEILVRMAQVVARNPDLFSINTKEWPEWAKDGDIHPPKPKPGKQIPSDIERMVLNGTAEVIGYAHTKHRHEAWTMVPRSDVDEFDPVFTPDNPVEFERVRHTNSHKRRKTDRHDATYRGSDYF